MAEEQGIISYDPATTNMVLDRMYQNRNSFPFDTEAKQDSEKGITSGAVYAAVSELKGATVLNKGYWPDSNSLMAGVPSAEEGSIAYVGANAPYAIYRYASGGWADTGQTYTPEVDPGEFKVTVDKELDAESENPIANRADEGTDGTDKYTLETAIVKVPESLRNIGIKCSFLDEGGKPQTWEFTGGSWAGASFSQVGSAKMSEMEKQLSSQIPVIEEAKDAALANISGMKDDALQNIAEKEQEAVSNFNAQRVTPEMLSESTKQLINTAGGGTVNNLPDDEDLTTTGGDMPVLKLADRAYNPANFSGKGYRILRRNIVEGKNVLTQEMVNEPDTVYEIRYDFDLDGETVSVPEGCILKFEGGSLNNGTLTGNDTVLLNEKVLCAYSGTFLNNSGMISGNRLRSGTGEGILTITSQKDFDEWANKEDRESKIVIDSVLPLAVSDTIVLNSDVEIHGKNCTLTCKSEKYSLASAVSIDSTHYTCRLHSRIECFSLFRYKDKVLTPTESSDRGTLCNLVEKDAVYVTDTTFKLPISDNLAHLSDKTFSKAFGWIDSWYFCTPFKVNSSDGEYFYCESLSDIPKDVFANKINGERRYSSPLSYVLYNMEESSIYYDDEYIHIPLSYEEISVIHHNEKPLFKSNGFSLKTFNVNVEDCCSFAEISNSYMLLNNCTFRHVLGNCIRLLSSVEDCIVETCSFRNCTISPLGGTCIREEGGKKKLKVDNCFFKKYDDICLYKNASGGVVAWGSELEVCNSAFINFCRDHVYVTRPNTSVYNNRIFNTHEFNSRALRNLSRDFGGIYVNHFSIDADEIINNTTKALIHHNVILNIMGKGDARGIFIDDGRGDVVCECNIIDGQFFSIDARKAGNTEVSSCRVQYRNNILLSPYRLEYGEGLTSSDIPVLSDNICTFTEDSLKSNVSNTNNIYTNGIQYRISNDTCNVQCDRKLDGIIQNSMTGMFNFINLSSYIPSAVYKRSDATDACIEITVNGLPDLSTTNNVFVCADFINYERRYSKSNLNVNLVVSTVANQLRVVMAPYSNPGNYYTTNPDKNGTIIYGACKYVKESDQAKFYIISLNNSDNYTGSDMFLWHMNVISNTVNATFSVERKYYDDIKDELADCTTLIFPTRSISNAGNIVRILKQIAEKYKEINLTGATITSRDGISVNYADGSIRRSDSLPFGSFLAKPTENDGISIGFPYFCTDKQTAEGAKNGIVIYYAGNGTWVDALGRTVE